jgi:hypothetical protein
MAKLQLIFVVIFVLFWSTKQNILTPYSKIFGLEVRTAPYPKTTRGRWTLLPKTGLNHRIGAMMLRGGALEIEGHYAAPLERCQEWLEATTFDGSEVLSAFRGGWGNPENSTLETRLWMAAELGDGRAVQNLVDAGVNINAGNLYNQTALHKAAQSGHSNLWCLSVLLSLG